MFTFVRLDHGEHGLRDSRADLLAALMGSPVVTRLFLVLLATAMVFLAAIIAAAGAAKLARLDGATYPAALMRAATVFAAALTLVATLTTALAQVLS
ncbi:hypothetical protein [Streptomyces sp. NPDC014995]|uniref:hypothetical protein n=1 Tax=Streptomyces sp. NPDC014995 TaxID=3364936 RepID=UPI0036F89BD4